MPRKKRLHFKDIDGLRFFFSLPVLLMLSLTTMMPQGEGFTVELAHASNLIAISSYDFLFFISAFLISSHALREYKYKESFNLKYFYVRRILKIILLLIIVILFMFLVHPWIVKVLKLFTLELPYWKSYVIGIPNYMDSFNGSQNSVQIVAWLIFMVLQFYFVWGLVLKFFKNKLVLISLIAVAIGVIVRYIHLSNSAEFTYDPLSYLAPIGIGTIVAIIIREEHPILTKIKALKKPWLVVIYIMTFLHVCGAYLLAPKLATPFIPLIGSVLFGLVIIEQTFANASPFKLRKFKFLAHFGKISFGIIVFHAIFSILVFIGIESLDFDLTGNFIKAVALILTFALAWLCADLSYHFLEQPLNSFRRDFKRE